MNPPVATVTSTADSRVAERVVTLAARNPRAAIRAARGALALPGRSDAAGRGKLLRAAGHALRGLGQYRAALTLYHRARSRFRLAGLDHERAICALGMVDAYMHLGRVIPARRVAAGAARVFRRHRDHGRLAKLHVNLGNLFHHLEDLERAFDYYERARVWIHHSGNDIDRATLDHNRANVLTHLGRRREAERLYSEARVCFERAGETIPALQCGYGLACLRFLNGEHATAIAELEQLRPHLERTGARALLAMADLDLSEVLVALRLHSEALALARSAAQWFRRHGTMAHLARCELSMGVALLQLGRLALARRRLDSADLRFRRAGHEAGRAAVALARAQLVAREGRHAEAVRQALRAHRVFRRTGFPLRALSAGCIAAESRLAEGDWAGTRALVRTLERPPRRAGDGYSRSRLARAEAAAAYRQGDRDAALRRYKDALREATRAQSALFVDEWRVGFLDGEPATLSESLAVLLERRPLPRAREVWAWIRRARRAGSFPVPDSPVESSSRERIDALRAELQACYTRLWSIRGGRARNPVPGMRRDLERRAITLERKLRRLAALRSTTVPRRASDLGSTPDFGALRIVYFAAGPRLCALVQRGESWSLIENLAHVEDVDAAVRLLLYQMAARPRTSGSPVRDDVLASRVRGHLDRIGRMVLDPVLDSGPPPPRICIQPHGSLARVPFAALSWRGRPLVWGSDLALEFGATPETEPRRRDRALVVGYSELEVDHVEREAIGVGRTLREAGCPAHVLLGSQSSFAAICEGVRTVTHLHLSGHAIYRSEHPEFSAMRVADGWLHAVDLAGLPLDGVTVVLSACETGPRGVVSGDEVLGMVRACMRAGARTIVASLWRVDGAAAQRFMQQLYREWQRRGMLGAALGAVQRQASRTGDPYHWAAFCLVGDPASPWPGILQPQRTERRKMEEAHARV